jgi:hypothetical protein
MLNCCSETFGAVKRAKRLLLIPWERSIFIERRDGKKKFLYEIFGIFQ